MALTLGDRVKETTTVTGTGPATLLGATTGFQSFAVVGNGNTTYYCIADQGGPNWEVGIGTYTSASNTLARTTVLASSNAGALVTFTTGIKDVFVTYPAEKGVWYDASGNVLFTGTTTAANLAYTGTLTGSTGILNIGSGQVYKDASGNVGIGTSSPNALLTVKKGSLTYNPTNASYYAASIYNAQNSTTRYGLQVRTNWGSTENKIVSFGNVDASTGADTEHFGVDGLGNVGIGTSSPAQKLEIAGNNYQMRLGQGGVIGVYDIGRNPSTGEFNFYGYQTGTVSYIFGGVNGEFMRINSAGSVGIGTSSIGGKFVVESNNNMPAASGTMNTGVIFQAGGTSQALNLGSSVTNNVSWINAAYSNNSGVPSNLAFMTGATEQMRIDSSGNLLVGTTSSATKCAIYNTSSNPTLDVISTVIGNPVVRVLSTAAGDISRSALNISKYDNNSTTSQIFAQFLINNFAAGSGQINANGANAAAFGAYSDSRLKEHIVDLPSQLKNILALRPVEFDYIESEGGGHQIGFIAQEVQEIYPDLVGTREDGMFTISDMNKNDARLIKAIQELKAIIDTQQEQINSLLGK